MKSLALITLLSGATNVAAHAATTALTLDGVRYRGFDTRVDPQFPGLKSAEWTYKNPPFMGMAPVVDLKSPDIVCQKDAKPPNLRAVTRAGASAIFQWTAYYQQHKGVAMTYMGYQENDTVPLTEIKWFKIDEWDREPGSVKWANDRLKAQNYTWTSQIPSDIKPGNYILRHELLALHDAKQQYNGKFQSGAQFFPVCYNIQVIGDGTVEPEGKTLPGMYSVNDIGIKVSLADVLSNKVKYVIPGGPKYNGAYNPPTGPKPVVTETGEIPENIRGAYYKQKAIYSFITAWSVEGGDYYAPGEGDKPSATFDPKQNWPKLYNGLQEIYKKDAKSFENDHW